MRKLFVYLLSVGLLVSTTRTFADGEGTTGGSDTKDDLTPAQDLTVKDDVSPPVLIDPKGKEVSLPLKVKNAEEAVDYLKKSYADDAESIKTDIEESGSVILTAQVKTTSGRVVTKEIPIEIKKEEERASAPTSPNDRANFLQGESLLSPNLSSKSSLSGLGSGIAEGLAHSGESLRAASHDDSGESLLQRESSLSKAHTALRSAVQNYSQYKNTLNPTVRDLTRASLLTTARNKIDFPQGTLDSSDNDFIENNQDNPAARDSTRALTSLIQKDLNEVGFSDKLETLNKLALDPFFQGNAEKFFGSEAMKDFNIALLGAKLLDASSSTLGDLLGINKALNGELDKLITILGLDPTKNIINSDGTNKVIVASVEDWMEIAKTLSSEAYTEQMADKTLSSVFKQGFKDLSNLVKTLDEYKSRELLRLVSVPLKFDVEKALSSNADKILESIRKTLNSKDIDFSELAPADNEFLHKELRALYKKLLELKSTPDQFLTAFLSVYNSDRFKNTWFDLDMSAFLTARKALALQTLTWELRHLQKPKNKQSNLTQLIVSSFEVIDARLKEAAQRELVMQKEDEIRIETQKATTNRADAVEYIDEDNYLDE